MKHRTLILLAVAIMFLSVSSSAFAQDNYYNDNWRERRSDRFYSSRVKQSVKRVDKLSGQLKDDVDRALDRSGLDGRNGEDRINDLVSDFHSAAAIFKDKYDSGRDPYRAEREARQVLALGFQLDRFMDRNELSGRVHSKWSQIMNDLRVIQQAYEHSEYSSSYDYRYE